VHGACCQQPFLVDFNSLVDLVIAWTGRCNKLHIGKRENYTRSNILLKGGSQAAGKPLQVKDMERMQAMKDWLLAPGGVIVTLRCGA
jgi:hypothetical protein